MSKRSPEGIIRERLRNKNKAKVNYEDCREYGICYRCRKKCDINPKTGKTYHACRDCLDYWNETHKGGYGGMADAEDLKSSSRNTVSVQI